MDNSLVLLLLETAIVGALLPIMLKKYIQTDSQAEKIFLMILSIIVAITIIYFYIKLLNEYDLGTSFAIVKVLSIIVVLIFSILFYKEKLDSSQIIGVILAMISISLLYSPKN